MNRLILIFILIFINFQVFAQQASKHVPQQLPLQAYGNLPQVSMVRISPSGKNVALRYTRGEQGVIDADRVCIVISYGGYAALAGAAFTPDVYKCAVSINGVSDVEAMIDNEKFEYGSDHWLVSYWQDLIDKDKLGDDFLETISPINYIDKIKSPVLLIHGKNDTIVPFEQSENMFDELEDEGKTVTFIELEDEGYHLSKNETRLQTLNAIDAFIHKHI
jgi:dipeptidyl aminopeptidase/acylaminoacyl peptidase